MGGGKAKAKSRGKICFNTTVKLAVDPVASHHPYNPFSSSEEEEGEASCEDRSRSRVRGRSVAGDTSESAHVSKVVKLC